MRALLCVLLYILRTFSANSHMLCQSSDQPEVTEFLLDNNVPLVASLSKGLPVGSVISLEGSIPADAQEFSLDLLAPEDGRFSDQPPLALSFRARFDLEQVHHNSFLRQTWGQQEIPYWFPLRSGTEFNITFQSDEKGFKIDVDEVLFWMFFHRVDPNKVSHVKVSGDIILHKMTYLVGVQKTCRPRAELHAQELPITGAAPYLSLLQHPFSTGSVVSVTGTLHSTSEWLVINLQSDGDIEEVIVLQFNVRLKEGAILHNTYYNGWGWDYINNTVPFQKGADFTVDFHSDDRHIKICINGVMYSRYDHRLNPERVNMVMVNGALTLKSVVHYTNGTQTLSSYLPFKTCSPLGATPSFKNMLCELCSRLPNRDMSVMTTPMRSKRRP